VTGGGGNFDEYIIHNIEMAVALMKGKFQKVKVESVGRQAICRCVAEDGREAVLLFSYAMEYSVTAEDGSKRLKRKAVASDFFKKLIARNSRVNHSDFASIFICEHKGIVPKHSKN
jgi:hypothetical protein